MFENNDPSCRVIALANHNSDIAEYWEWSAEGLYAEGKTGDPASRFKESSRRGRLAPGMDGDIVVLGADPIRGSRAFADVRDTIRPGRVIFER